MANEGSPANPSLSGAQILAKLLALGAVGAAFSDDVFAIKGSADATKLARFEVDGLTTATTRVYTLPDANIVVSGSASALTSGRVPFATTGGLLTDSAALTWSGTSFATTATGAASFSTAGGYTSTVATGTAPFTATSTTACPNLNASLLLGSTWAIPGAIGSTTKNTGAFTTLTANGATTLTAGTASTSTSTGTFVVTGGAGISGALYVGGVIQSNTSIRCYGGGLLADFGSGGGTGGAASTIETNANIVLWSSNFYYDGANDVRARAGGASRLRMDITTGATAGDIVFQGAVTGAANAVIAYANIMTLKADGSRVLIATTSDDATNALQVNGAVTVATGSAYKVNNVQVVAARDTGWTAMTGSPDKATSYATGTVTLAQLAGRVAQLQASLTTHGLIGA